MLERKEQGGSGTVGQWKVCPFRYEGLAKKVHLKLELTMHEVGRKHILGRKNSWQNWPKRSSSKSLRREKVGWVRESKTSMSNMEWLIRRFRMVGTGLADRHSEFACSMTISHWEVFKLRVVGVWFIFKRFICLSNCRKARMATGRPARRPLKRSRWEMIVVTWRRVEEVVKRSNSEYILKIVLIGLASGLDIKGEWKGDFWFTHLIGWRCCYSDEKNWRKGGFGRGWSEGQFWTCCFWNVSETSKWRRQTGSWEAQGRTHQSSGERSGLRFTLQPTLVSLLAHLFPVNALGTISWITMTFWSPDPMDDFQSHFLQHLTQLATLSLKHIMLLLWHSSPGFPYFCGWLASLCSLNQSFPNINEKKLELLCIYILILSFLISIFLYVL